MMVWGAIGVREKSDLIITHGNIDATYYQYQDQIVSQGLLPLLKNLPNRDNMEFQHDMAAPSTQCGQLTPFCKLTT